MQTLVSLFGRQMAAWMRSSLLSGVQEASTATALPRDWYGLLRAYYEANGLYQALREAGIAHGLGGEALRSIKNPAFRCVEFYAATLWPGTLPDALPIVTENERIVAPIQQVWQWSNWGARKQTAARRFAMLGDWFVKVRSTGDMLPSSERRVWFQQLDPGHVTDFEKDDRGYLTYVRIDVPQIRTDSAGAVVERWSHVEVWDKASGTYRQWRHMGDSAQAAVEMLTGLEVADTIEALTGVDFIPIVHAQFRDVGDMRGVGCFVPVLDKIDELNRIATRLHQMGFRNMRNIWASLRSGVDGSNRPLPAAPVGRAMTAINQARGGTVYNDNGTVRATADETFIDLPGSTDLKSLVPQLAYGDLLDVVREAMNELESDLPEIRWYRLAEQGADLTGRAIRLLMAPAAKRVEEARGNGETALARADEMALSMAQAIGLFGGIGTYENGDLAHSFEPREVFPETRYDEAEANRAEGQAAQALKSAGVPLSTILTRTLGMTDEEARRTLAMAEREANIAMERAAAFSGDDRSEDEETI